MPSNLEAKISVIDNCFDKVELEHTDTVPENVNDASSNIQSHKIYASTDLHCQYKHVEYKATEAPSNPMKDDKDKEHVEAEGTNAVAENVSDVRLDIVNHKVT